VVAPRAAVGYHHREIAQILALLEVNCRPRLVVAEVRAALAG